MENNNAIAAQGPEGEAKIENVKPTAEEEGSPNKGRGGYNRYSRRRPVRREVNAEDETGKWAIRHKIWTHLEENNLVNAPRPCSYRIPNFEGTETASDQLTSLEEFKKARTVKVNPDKAQAQTRFLVLEEEKELVLLNQSEKTLQAPTEQSKTGLLVQVIPPEDADKEQLKHCCTSQGVAENSKEISLETKVKLDMIFIGSVAVSREGYRIGKGKGYADLEYAMMRTLGAADENTVVVTSVHDSQVVDIPKELVGEHDVTVDYILTPTEVIKTNCSHPKPAGVVWDHLDIAKFYQIPVLRQLREIEREAGKNVMLKDQKEEDEDPVDSIKPAHPQRFNRYNNRFRGRGRGYGSRFRRGGGRGGRRRQTDGDESNKENVETGDESGADGDNDARGRRPRNYRNRRFRRGGRRSQASESEHSDGGADGNPRDEDDDRPGQRRYQNRRRYVNRGRRFGGMRRDYRASGDHSGSDGEQKTSGDEEEGGRRAQRPRFRTNLDAIVFVGQLPRNLRVSELKTELRSHNVNPMRLLWRGARGFAFLFFMETSSAKEAVNVLSGRELDGKEIKVEMANMERQRRRGRAVNGEERGGDDENDARDR